MKMTREEVADLLLRMKDDCSNVEDYDGNGKFYEARGHTLETLLYHISKGAFFRIKDNSVKEVTLDLLDRVVIRKDGKGKGKITYVELDNAKNSAYVSIGIAAYNLTNFNNYFQLVED